MQLISGIRLRLLNPRVHFLRLAKKCLSEADRQICSIKENKMLTAFSPNFSFRCRTAHREGKSGELVGGRHPAESVTKK